MNILVTGARGFVGKNLVAALQNIRDGKDRTHPELDIREIFEYDTDGSPEQLADYAKSADFVFHLAGVNRPKTAEEYLPRQYRLFGNTACRIAKRGQPLPRDAGQLRAGISRRALCGE